jgi:hypothetical protein
VSFNFGALRSSFFDAAAVKKAVDTGTRKVLSKFGAYVRTRARSSIRKRKQPSPPGKPPSSHAGQLRLIFFAWDPMAQTVVVGPIPFRSKGGESGVVPRLLERGGVATLRSRSGAARKAVYAPRPYMLPALAAEMPQFAAQLKGLMR